MSPFVAGIEPGLVSPLELLLIVAAAVAFGVLAWALTLLADRPYQEYRAREREEWAERARNGQRVNLLDPVESEDR